MIGQGVSSLSESEEIPLSFVTLYRDYDLDSRNSQEGNFRSVEALVAVEALVGIQC